MHLAKPETAAAFADAGIHDFLVSIHGIARTARAIHGRGMNNAARQMQALDNLRALDVPFRFNVTMIRDNLTQLGDIAALAADKGARVVNFLTFNPYFEWERDVDISFQARHSEIAPFLMRAIDICTSAGVEANVRYLRQRIIAAMLPEPGSQTVIGHCSVPSVCPLGFLNASLGHARWSAAAMTPVCCGSVGGLR